MQRQALENIKKKYLEKVISSFNAECKYRILEQLKNRHMPYLGTLGRRFIIEDSSYAHRVPRAKQFHYSWLDNLEADVDKAWAVELQKTKENGTYPMSWEEACHIAAVELEEQRALSRYARISMCGLRNWIAILVMGYPLEMWEAWPDRPLDLETLADHIPAEVETVIKKVYDRINKKVET